MPEHTPIGELRKYYGYLSKERAYWDRGIWKDIVENILVSREDLDRTAQKGKRKGRKIYDTMPIVYANINADGLHGNIINQAIQWFILRLPKQFRFLEEVPEVRLWLQETQEQLYYVFQESNFYSTMRQYFKDGITIGTANKYIEEDKAEERVIFHAIHPRETYIAENKFGHVDVMFRKFMMTARNMKDDFGYENLSTTVQQSLTLDPFTEFEVIHAVYPNKEFDDRRLGNTYKKFASRWFEHKTADKVPHEDKFLREKGYDLFPYQVWRHTRGENGPYGDSPTVFALAEIMTLQVMRKTLLRGGNIAVDPAYNIPSEMKNRARVWAGGHNYYGPDFNRKISAIQSGINYPIGMDFVKDSREILKKHYNVNYFLMLEQAERQMTAREVTEKMGEKASLQAPTTGDISIILDQDIDYVFDIEMRAGRIPPPPDILIQYLGGKRIPIEYMGPLMQAQKKLFETRGIVDSLEIAREFIELFPGAADYINEGKTFKDLVGSYGFPQDDLNDADTVKMIREGRAQREAEEMKKMDFERMADTFKALSQASKNSSQFAEQIQEIMSGAGGGGMALPAA